MECCDRATSLVLSAVHGCFIGKPRKPCCGQGMKVALVVLAVRHSQQQIACLPVVPIGKQAQIRNVVVCHLSVGRCEYAFRSTLASGSPARCAPLPKPRISACSTFNSPKPTAVRSSCRLRSSVNCLSSLPKSALARCGLRRSRPCADARHRQTVNEWPVPTGHRVQRPRATGV